MADEDRLKKIQQMAEEIFDTINFGAEKPVANLKEAVDRLARVVAMFAQKGYANVSNPLTYIEKHMQVAYLAMTGRRDIE